MGENRERLGRKVGFAWRGRLAALTGAGAVSVALIMMLTPAAGAVSAGTIIGPAYKGAAVPTNDYSVGGCASLKVTKPYKVSLKTGVGGGSDSGSMKACTGLLSTYESDASDSGGAEVAIPVPISSSTSSVQVNLAWKVAYDLKQASGSKTGACAATDTYNYEYADLYWGYNATYGYYYYDNISYNDTYTGGSYSYSYGNPAPSPFNYNATSESYTGDQYGAYGDCDVYEYAEMYTSAELDDLSTGSYLYSSGQSFASYPVDVSLELYNYTEWGCDLYSDWYGTSGTWYNSTPSTACYSYNSTYTSYTYVNGVSTSGTLASQTASGTTSGSGTVYFNASSSLVFNGSNKYVAYVYFDVYQYMYLVDWVHGSQTWSFNMATLGNGWSLKSISVT